MNGRMLRQLARSLGALILLGGILVAPPVFLGRAIGWPLPTRLPALDQVREALSGSTIDDHTIIKALALVCWVAWLQILVSIAVEVHAYVRGTIARHVPFGALVQPAVRQLVIAAALILGGLRSSHDIGLAFASPSPVAALVDPSPSPAAPVAPAPMMTARDEQQPAATITVRPRDSLWRLAERHLGTGVRWRELWELNRDRDFPDGRDFHNPNLIQPGWTLICPPDAVHIDPPAATPPSPAAPAPAAAPAPPPSNAPAAPPGAAPAAVHPPTSLPGAVPSVDHDGEDHSALPLGLIAGSLSAAGLIVVLDRLRRIQLRKRRVGHAPPVAPAETAASEQQLRCAALDAPTDRLDLALRAFAGCLAGSGTRVLPTIDLVTVGPKAIEILLTSRLDVNYGPFDVGADRRAWTLPTNAPRDEVERLAAGQAALSPALVTLGNIEDRQLLLDVETSPRVLVTGDHDAARRMIRSAAIEMTTSWWADDIDVLMLGDQSSQLDRLERVTVVSSHDELVDHLARVASAADRDLEAANAGSTLECRVRNPADPWTPTVVFIPEPAAPDEVERLFELVSPGRGVAVIASCASGGVGCDRELVVTETGVTLEPTGLRMRAASFSDELLADADTLLAAAFSDEPGPALTVDAEITNAPLDHLTAVAPESGGVIVAVLGTVEVRGAERPIDRRRSVELIAYLALHPEGVDEAKLRVVLWPDADPSRENFNQTVSRARQPLGHAADGTLHLARIAEESGGLYRLGPMVTTDASLVEAAYQAAQRSPSDATIDHLSSMLGLVRGIPFEGTKGGWTWTDLENWSSRLSALASDAAHIVAQWSLERGDMQRALWATAQGLRAAPGDEVLYRDRMQAHDRAGNLAGVEAVMQELRRTVEEGEPYDSIHPDTLAYYEQLTRRVRRTG
jgi:hypothetical protein